MRIFVPRERDPGETRVPLIPQSAKRFGELGADVVVESGVGASLGIDDEAYEATGCRVAVDRPEELSQADMILRLGKPPEEEVRLLQAGTIHVSYLDPFNESSLVDSMTEQGITTISMEMIPRTTLAQKMDALSSQANLAGYVAVILAAERLDKVYPMMMTPAGTIAPSRVFVIGVGVAGLQAIATAKRLGARVEAFDTRPVVEEQVASLGAKFVKVDLGETGQTKDGYARDLSEEQQARQREAMAGVCAQSDVVITTAQLFGRKAPLIVTRDMVDQMRPGSVIVDLAVESGGNVEGAVPGEEVEINGIRIIGLANLPGRVRHHASQMYSSNLVALVEHFWDGEAKAFKVDLEDEILQGCVVAHQGEVVNEALLRHRGEAE